MPLGSRLLPVVPFPDAAGYARSLASKGLTVLRCLAEKPMPEASTAITATPAMMAASVFCDSTISGAVLSQPSTGYLL